MRKSDSFIEKKNAIFLVASFLLVGVFLFFESSNDVSQEQLSEPTLKEHSDVMKTNSWFSSVYKGFPTAPMFALPGAYQFDESGLAISFPHTVATPNTVFGSFDRFCSVGMEAKTTNAKIIRYGDWDALFEVESGSTPWQVHMTQGSPVVMINNFQEQLILSCKDNVIVSSVEQGILIKRGSETILVQPKGIFSFERDSVVPNKIRLSSSEKSYRVILIPQQTEKSIAFFSNLPWNNILDTQVSYSQENNGTIRAEYSFKRDNESDPILTTLWPHHRLSPNEHQGILGEYQTSTGNLELIQASSFVTMYSNPELRFDFDRVSDPLAIEAIKRAVEKDLLSFQGANPPGGVYFLGTWLGALASTTQIAHLYGMKKEERQLLDILQDNLLSSLKNFSYREDLSMFVAKNTEFGNDQGNDHNFHYGYYLRAASVLVSLRPELRTKLDPTVNELVKDIANTDRSSKRYPYIRNFSPYDGHSWADGYALFADGNDQESTSEALNAWYGLWMWGSVTSNDDFQKTGETLFAIELGATKAYWFGVNNPFPKGYSHTIASLVWGGKRDYATWFSGQAMHIQGIQWLPITPASAYLHSLPSFTERKQELLKAHPLPAQHEWGDLYAAQLSFSDPAEAKNILPMAAKNQGMKSTALLYQTVYRNAELFQ